MSKDTNAKPAPAKAKRPRRKQKGALAAIGALLLASALVRVGAGATEALAREEGSEAAQHQAEPAHGEQLAADTRQSAEAAQPMADSDILPLINALKAREDRVRKREEAIDVRMQALSVAEQEIERRMTALVEAENRLRETLTLARTAAEDDLSQLTDVYAKMKPKQAAALFQQMDPQFAAGFLSRMRPDSAAAIMAGMEPEAAYLISVILAGRNADVPNE